MGSTFYPCFMKQKSVSRFLCHCDVALCVRCRFVSWEWFLRANPPWSSWSWWLEETWRATCAPCVLKRYCLTWCFSQGPHSVDMDNWVGLTWWLIVCRKSGYIHSSKLTSNLPGSWPRHFRANPSIKYDTQQIALALEVQTLYSWIETHYNNCSEFLN